MKTNAIVRIVLYSLVLALLMGILAAGLCLDLSDFVISGGEALENDLGAGFSVNAERISKVSIDWAAGSIVLRAGEPQGAEGDITVMPNGFDERYPITFEFDGDTLKLSYTNTSVGIFTGSIPEKDLIIWVPENWICQKFEIDGAAVELTVENVDIGTLDIDGAACIVELQGVVDTIDCDGAACELTLECASVPSSIDLDGASCVLDLTLPEDCGFRVNMDGLGCSFNSDLPYTVSNGEYLYGDHSCRITADGLSCEVTVRSAK